MIKLISQYSHEHFDKILYRIESRPVSKSIEVANYEFYLVFNLM